MRILYSTADYFNLLLKVLVILKFIYFVNYHRFRLSLKFTSQIDVTLHTLDQLLSFDY